MPPSRVYAALLDDAGSVSVLRFADSGRVTGRAQIAGVLAIAQVITVPGGVLVRRVDHRIDRFDPTGALTGSLRVSPGARVVELAVRRDHVIAGLTDAMADGVTADPRARVVRPIDLAPLAWGPPRALAVARPPRARARR